MRNSPISISKGSQKHRLFWREHPVLLSSLTVSIGSASALYWPLPWNAIFAFSWVLYLLALRKWAFLPLLLGMAAYSHFLYGNMPPSQKTQGVFSIATLQPHQSPFAKGFVYKGKFAAHGGTVPCDIYTHGSAPPEKADRDYILQGKLEQRGPCQYTFKPEVWIPVEKSWSLAEIRFELKERYRAFLSRKCPSPRAAAFLSALTTGDVDDRLLKYQFGRLGLQHLLAISGFHFGVLIAFASFALSLFLPRTWKTALLLIALAAYFLFVGPYPAVERSWIAATAYLIGQFIRRDTSGLNLLGLALGLEAILNPLIASNLGFQFSFGSCLGILLLYPRFKGMLFAWFPKRPSGSVKPWPPIAKAALILSNFFRNAIALNLAVNAAILPLLLYHFHSFPLLSLLYNLFFPFAVGAALSLLLCAFSIYFLSPTLAHPFFSIASSLSETLLDLAAYPPASLDYMLLVPRFPFWAVPLYLFLLLCLSIRLRPLPHSATC